MKKLLVIVGYDSSGVEVFCDQVDALFGGELELGRRVAGRFSLAGEPEADLFLFPSYDAWARSGGPGAPSRPVLFADRTVSRAGFDRLSCLPEGSEAILYDATPELAGRMVAALLQMGARHLRLAPDGDGEPRAGAAAIVLGEPDRAPASAARVVDLGRALLSVGTLIDLGFRLGLDRLLVQRSVRTAYRELVTDDVGLAAIIDKTNRLESSHEILLDVIDAGVVGVSAEGRILSCNEKARAIAGAGQGELVGASWTEAFAQLPLGRVLETRQPVKDTLVKIGGYDVVCSADLVVNSGTLYGAIAVFNRFSEEERKQHRIRAQLIGKGYRARYAFDDICAVSAAMVRCKESARRMARSSSSVLVYGESGTGKEMLAQAIHNASDRRDYQFVPVNCGALPESLLESELFGYEEGAFTGARRGGKPGLFELAHRGTIFLDEIGEMPPGLQSRLLRALEERQVMRLGGDRLIDVDIRVIAATNRDLKGMVAGGAFREDLFYRLSVLPLHVPPLRERPEDILPLVRLFQRAYDFEFEMSPEVERLFLRHRFRGNARELRNYVEFVANLGIRRVEVGDLPFEFEDKGPPGAGIPTRADGALAAPAETAEEGPAEPYRAARAGRAGTAPGAGGDGPASPSTLADSRLAPPAGRESAWLFALTELERAFRDGRRLGRRSLFARARERKLFLSEPEIRSTLRELADRSLATIRPGRGGTVVTPLGLTALEYLKRRGAVGSERVG